MKRFRFQIPEKWRLQLRPSLSLFVIVLLTVLALNIAFFANVREGIQSRVYALGVGIGRIYTHLFSTKATLQSERDHYRSIAQELSVEQTKIQDLQKQIRELERLIQYRETVGVASVPARILARGIEERQAILLDKGSSDGVLEGQAMVVDNGHMIGYITRVQPQTSIGLLLSDSSANTPANIEGGVRASGLIEGRDGFFLKMNFVPKSETVSEADVIVTSGLDQNIPGGLIIGLISEIIDVETSPFYDITVEPLVEPQDHTRILILNPKP